jgi:hypothetical protein
VSYAKYIESTIPYFARDIPRLALNMGFATTSSIPSQK